jgi:hypothetical protein
VTVSALRRKREAEMVRGLTGRRRGACRTFCQYPQLLGPTHNLSFSFLKKASTLFLPPQAAAEAGPAEAGLNQSGTPASRSGDHRPGSSSGSESSLSVQSNTTGASGGLSNPRSSACCVVQGIAQ